MKVEQKPNPRQTVKWVQETDMSYRADALDIDNAAYGEGVASVVTAVNVKN